MERKKSLPRQRHRRLERRFRKQTMEDFILRERFLR